jgi:hypothetical protein
VIGLLAVAWSRSEGIRVRSDYWNVSDEQVVEKTGKPLAHWRKVLDKFGAGDRKSNDTVAHLQKDHSVPRYWARTLTTWYLKQAGE